jgi:glycosidase
MLKKLGILLSLFALTFTVAAPSNGAELKPAPAWASDAVIYEVNLRQYTEAGTFDEFAKELPRLKELGVDILWFMPIHEISLTGRKGTLGSYYSVSDYRSVNSEHGTKADFAELVDAAHAAGFKVLLDWVANHTGFDHQWTVDHPDWYMRDSAGTILPPNPDWTDVAELNFANADMRKQMIADMKYWIEEFNIDGYRLDHTDGVPDDFWRAAAAELNKVKEIFLLAETGAGFGLMEDSFDANYNWELKDVINRIGSNRSGASEIYDMMESQSFFYSAGTFPMNFITNHDENSWSGTEYDRLGSAVPALTAVYFTLPGMPLVYTGQEIGLDKQLQFFEKDTIDWGNKKHLSYLQALIDLKHSNTALDVGVDEGDFSAINSGNDSVISFLRTNNSDRVITVANVSSADQIVTLELGAAAGSYREIFSNTVETYGSEVQFVVPAFGYYVLDSNLDGGADQSATATKIISRVKLLKVKQQTQLIVKTVPAVLPTSSIKWKSLTPKIAKVSKSGLVTGLAAGKAKIQVIVGTTKLTLGLLIKK